MMFSNWGLSSNRPDNSYSNRAKKMFEMIVYWCKGNYSTFSLQSQVQGVGIGGCKWCFLVRSVKGNQIFLVHLSYQLTVITAESPPPTTKLRHNSGACEHRYII